MGVYKKLTALFRKHREAINYLFFGGLTTAVNYAVYAACFWIYPFSATTVPNVIAWLVSMAFAYVTNRRWVFHSTTHGVAIFREAAAFSGARVATLLLESALLWVLVDRLGLPNLIIKLAANVLVVLLNYILSKFWIFTSKRRSHNQSLPNPMEEKE